MKVRGKKGANVKLGIIFARRDLFWWLFVFFRLYINMKLKKYGFMIGLQDSQRFNLTYKRYVLNRRLELSKKVGLKYNSLINFSKQSRPPIHHGLRTKTNSYNSNQRYFTLKRNRSYISLDSVRYQICKYLTIGKKLLIMRKYT